MIDQQPAVSVGDRVRIVEINNGVKGTGREGTIGTVTRANSFVPYIVVNGYGVSKWERVDPVKKPAPAYEPTPDLHISPARLQAAKAAHEILGAAATPDELLVLAGWILRKGTPDEPGPNVADDPAPLVAQAPATDPEDLTIEDHDGDTVEFQMTNVPSNGVACVVSSRAGAYITADDVDNIIAWLQQARAARP